MSFLYEIIKNKTSFIHDINIDEDALLIWYAKVITKDTSLVNELEGYSSFQSLVLERIFGYDYRTIQSNTGSKRKVEFALAGEEAHPRCVIEIKGLGTDLFKVQSGRKRAESPIDQARNYARNQQSPYCIATDYNELVLCPFSTPDDIYFSTSFEEIVDKISDEEFNPITYNALEPEAKKLEYLKMHFCVRRSAAKVLFAIFHKKALIDHRLIDTLRQRAYKQEHEMTSEFYRLFHECRLQLIWEIRLQNPDIDLKSVVHQAQLILNRWLFICYAETKPGSDLMPSDLTSQTVSLPISEKRILKSHQGLVKSELDILFSMLKNGEPIRGIHGYDGGLFAESLQALKIRDWIPASELGDIAAYSGQVELDELSTKKGRQARIPVIFGGNSELYDAFQEYLSYGMIIHPFWLSLIRIASYDFAEDISVEMLGNVFEQSITDLERIVDPTQSKSVGKRKKHGIYYTPDFITDYITRNSIASYLLRSIGISDTRPIIHTHEVLNLFMERSSLDSLEKLVKDIRILDLACGSGAFLNKAVDVLLEYHEKINSARQETMLAARETKRRKKIHIEENQVELTSWLSDLTRQVLLQNVFGVDLNEESVLITRLSLFLKILGLEKRELPALHSNIIVGNSIISSVEHDLHAIDWSKAFGGKPFDVIIGNPPYVKLQNLEKGTREALKNEYNTILEKGNYDLYLPFLYRGWNLLSESGTLGFIMPNKFFVTDYSQRMVHALVECGAIEHIVDFTWEQVFNDATTYTCILFISAPEKQRQTKRIFYQRVIELDAWRTNTHDIQINRGDLITYCFEEGALLFDDEQDVLNRLKRYGVPLGFSSDAYADLFVGLQTSADEVYILNHLSDTSKGTLVVSSYISKTIDAESAELMLESDLLVPVLMGQDIHRYETPNPSRRLLFPYRLIENKDGIHAFPYNEAELEQLPRAYSYFLQCKKRLERRYGAENLPDNQWFKYVYDKNLVKFRQQKIICQVLSSRCNFIFDDAGNMYFPGSGGGSGGYGVVIKPKGQAGPSREDYLELLAILNSMISDFWIKLHSSKFQHGFFSYSKMYLENLPIALDSLQHEDLIRCSEELINAYSEYQTRASAFDSWIHGKELELPPSFSMQNLVDEPETNLRDVILSGNKKVGVEALHEIALEFTATKKAMIELRHQILQLEEDINNCLFESYHLNDSLPNSPDKTFADIIRNHPFIRYFGN